MKVCLSLLFSVFVCLVAGAKVRTYVGSTPAHAVVRDFLEISSTDSIDFIRWKMEIDSGKVKLQCQYGLIKPGTPGFLNEQRVDFESLLTQSGNYYHLKHNNKSISILEVNVNVLHLLDRTNGLLIGNGGWSYTLNSIHPLEVDAFNVRSEPTSIQNPLVFEGRTPCQALSAHLGLNKREVCNKMKWYFLFYADSVTNKPSHFLMNGIGYRIETMTRGRWEIVTGQNGRIIYRLYCDKWIRSLDLQKGEDTILYFIDANGRLMVGNEDFSYALNRRKEVYPRIKE